MTDETPKHIIAIGASAGGMEEINTFFDYTPLDSAAYVIVQHLSPDFKSRMVELLTKHTRLKVIEAQETMLVKKNYVYLIPNNKFMTICDGRLHLTNKENVQGPHLTVNTFFVSLAADAKRKAIGVILSGLGADGTEGVKAIKQQGGMVIARNPETTQFGSMPSCAIATGLVDFVLEPDQMPATIEEYARHDDEVSAQIKEDEKVVKAIIELIKEQSPFDFSDYKPTTILRRIKRRAANSNFSKLEVYLDFLKTSPEELEALAQDFLISVTSFFRDKEAFAFLEDHTLPLILEDLTPDEEIKVWVAGCATGEEAYSIAMLVSEQLTGKYKDTVVKIFATDIDAVALAHAGKGIYTASIEKDVSAGRLERHFIKEGDTYKIKQGIRKMVIFAQHDLVKNPPYCNMQLITCRNVLIYLSPALQKKVFAMMLFGLKVNGYLFLGSSENPTPIRKSLEEVHGKWKIYRNLETKRAVRFDVFSLPEIKPATSYTSHSTAPKHTTDTLADLVNNSLVADLNCLAICVDEDNRFIKAYGDTTRYLLQKNFNLNLMELLPKPLAIAFNSLRSRVLKTGEKGTISGIPLRNDERSSGVTLSVQPLELKKGMPKMLLATIREGGEDITANGGEYVFDEKKYIDQHIINLEEELRETKEKLQAIHEKLDATNENMQSFNEELLSANEEMQSTNEEMQSINEELHTINADYQLKNTELQELNDDLNNYFKSNVTGQLVVNKDLLLMKFSPATVTLINLLPTDVGRPLSNISTNIKFETILEDIKQVIANGSVITKEVEAINSKCYQVITMPYIQQANNEISGAIITFSDITELKKIQTELDKQNENLLRINADLDNFVHVASHDLLAPLGNIEVSIDVMNTLSLNSEEALPILHVIKSSIKKFKSLINQISDVGKAENGMLEKEMVDMAELMHNVEWSLDGKIKTSGAVINKKLDVLHIPFSKKNLRSIVYNLVANAIKFKGKKPPVIDISTLKEHNNIILIIQDNGIGVHSDQIDRIFTIYSRVDDDIEGNGIGLYLVKKMIDASAGNIAVESKPGEGTKFMLYFKAEPEPSITYTSSNSA